MKHKDRSVWSDRIDLIKRGHPAFRELELGPTADHANPLRRWRPRCLLFQHPQGVCQRWHPIPTQLHIVVQATSNGMHMRIVEARNYGSVLGINQFRIWPTLPQNVFIPTYGADLPVGDGDGLDK